MSTPPNLAGSKALIVDADGTVRESLLRILRELGADAAEAESGPRGLAEATRARSAGRPFDLFFVAASMSPMNGIEFAEHLRKHPTEFARTILLVTPLTAVADLSQARAAGITLRVSKPILRAAIVSAVAEALSASLEPREPPAAASPPRRRVRVLLAEDLADVRYLIRSMIEGPDCQVDLAPDGAIAVDLFRMVGYDLVLMDLQMPGFDGYHAVREIRSWEYAERVKRTPVIAVTAYAGEERPDKTLAAGFDGYLLKPFEKRDLLQLIARHTARPAATPLSPRA